MNAVTKIREAAPADPLAMLRAPFPDHQVSKLPKESKKQREEREADRSKGVNCQICGGWHHKSAVHLDYVGHAALTDRLLDADPQWSWEPAALREGLPAFDATGGLWIRLTVCGVTRLGYGHAAAKPQMDPGAREKEVIGDALRNAAMRFGAALDLWHKGDLHLAEEATEADSGIGDAAERGIAMLHEKAKGGPQAFKAFWEMNKEAWKTGLTPQGYAATVAAMKEIAATFKAPAPAQPEPDPFAALGDDDIPDFAR